MHCILKEKKAKIRALMSFWPRDVTEHGAAVSKSQSKDVKEGSGNRPGAL